MENTLKEKYRENLKLAWESPRMVDFCLSRAEEIVETEDGWLIEVEKQYLKKDFCFGYGMYLNYTDEELEIAENNADYARTNVNHFIKENTKYYDEWINELEKNDCFISTNGKYYSQKENCKLQNYRCYDSNTPDENYKKLSDNDKQKLIDAFKAGKEKMIKRLNTYLKKFGLSKLNVWTYLVD